MSLQKDVVCGMQIEESEAVAQTDYMGKTYYFCATACKIRFDEEPEKYTHQTEGHE